MPSVPLGNLDSSSNSLNNPIPCKINNVNQKQTSWSCKGICTCYINYYQKKNKQRKCLHFNSFRSLTSISILEPVETARFTSVKNFHMFLLCLQKSWVEILLTSMNMRDTAELSGNSMCVQSMPSLEYSSCSLTKMNSLKNICSCSLAAFIQSCSKLFCSKFSKPEKSNIPMFAEWLSLLKYKQDLANHYVSQAEE